MDEINAAITARDSKKVASLIKKHGLKIENNKITADVETVKASDSFWDQRQLIKKILLNS